MSTQYDIMQDLKTAIEADANLSSWASAQFGRTVTVILTNRILKKIKPEQYPVAVIVFEPENVNERLTGETADLSELYHVEMGIHNDDPLVSLQQMADFEAFIALAVLADRERSGMAYHTEPAERIGDGDVNHPYHFLGLKFRVQRYGPY